MAWTHRARSSSRGLGRGLLLLGSRRLLLRGLLLGRSLLLLGSGRLLLAGGLLLLGRLLGRRRYSGSQYVAHRPILPQRTSRSGRPRRRSSCRCMGGFSGISAASEEAAAHSLSLPQQTRVSVALSHSHCRVGRSE